MTFRMRLKIFAFYFLLVSAIRGGKYLRVLSTYGFPIAPSDKTCTAIIIFLLLLSFIILLLLLVVVVLSLVVSLFCDYFDKTWTAIIILVKACIRPVHYRLSSIKGVRFRFANFASHFICVQIFQIDFPLILSAYKYFR